MAIEKVEICLKEKKASRAQISRYFRYESRNNKINAENLKTNVFAWRIIPLNNMRPN